MASQKLIKAARENGKLGGRPKGFAALEAERQRDYVAQQLVKEFMPIVKKAIEQAKDGNPIAREWLTNRAYGKPQEHVDHTTDGDKIPNPIYGGVSVQGYDSNKKDIPTH